MSRLSAAPEGAGRYDRLHGDEDQYFTTAHEQALIETIADQKLAARLYNDSEQFDDLLSGIDPSDYQPQLQRALRELDRACKGSEISRDAVLTALSQIQSMFKAEADRVWMDELRTLAEREVCGVEA